MGHEVSLKVVPARFAAVVRFRARAEEMAAKTPQAFARVLAVLDRLGLAPAGPALARFTPEDGAFQVEAGFYVGSGFEGSDGVACVVLAGGEVLTTTHIGPYDTLPEAYEAIQAWARDQHRSLADSMWEEYFSDPGSAPPSEWRTDVVWPLE